MWRAEVYEFSGRSEKSVVAGLDDEEDEEPEPKSPEVTEMSSNKINGKSWIRLPRLLAESPSPSCRCLCCR